MADNCPALLLSAVFLPLTEEATIVFLSRELLLKDVPAPTEQGDERP